VLVSADSVRALDCTARTVPLFAVSTSLLAVVLLDPVVLTPAIVTRRVGILAVWFRVGTTVVTSIIVSFFVITSVVLGIGFLKFRVAAVLPKVTVVVVPGELHESLVSPVGSPGVLYQHELRSVSDSSDGVVGPSSAGGVLEDSLRVTLEPVGDFKGHRESS